MEKQELIQKVLNGEIKIYQIENFTKTPKEAVELRREVIEKIRKVSLDHIGRYSLDPNNLFGKNIENMIGAVQVPMGIIGPLKVNGNYAKGDFYVPMATSEGALLASTNRGASVITSSGGVITTIFRDGMTRAPVIKLNSSRDYYKITEFIDNNFNEIKNEAEKDSRFRKLKRIVPYLVGRNLFLRFVYDTGDSMGMNGVTIGTEAALNLIESKFPDIKSVSLSGNLCTDKKSSAINMIEGRGKSITAEVVIPDNIIKEKLKTDAKSIIEVNYRKNLLGSAQAGSYGFNAHFANIVAAVFLATGQDIAQVVEGSQGFTTVEEDDKGVYFAVTMPSLETATVGGGTKIETQKEALNILGISGAGQNSGDNSKAFSEICASTVLAGEISLIGALAAKHLAKAHIEYGR
ncbi:MAG TPA: hydroxymethylglutaryl-CoA reductase (NADPH) [Methanofastidiosum sp.]|nr:hydroxymethylglutaryl-CoA reductase (NADPH) [Methanofastidiosum sp.]HOC77908.1 hydroxymethylglutaryl-CoA reductase (NADPH) [Methanofastidiosum sp.]HOG73547.1 hydroxymethylglutaryl-CoA reductase (NADPH) [Methanofastidiosum sp.]HPA49121.1 hydroxymethylglutaryl-CoA reductase (NADPH) [Methanofastidiosum sp.]HQK62747.1 hydroxymethylglutaryl-CoA reductase (NADPH) [Methanofastidiosum sp.]